MEAQNSIQYGQYIVPSSDVMVNFGVGQPSNSELPLEIIKEGCFNMLKDDDKSLLQYGDIPGYYEFRKVLANFLERNYEKAIDPDNLFITNGVTGALSLICSLYVKKCKRIYVEEPTYFLAINIFKEFGFEVVPINIHDDGINLDELEENIRKDRNSTKLLYTIPSFHNPTSITMSHEKRMKLANLSKKYNIHIIADEVYQLLYFEKENKPPLPLSTYSDNVYSISSFSKILAPSLRLGWIQTSDNLITKLKSCGQLDSSGGINPFISRIVHSIIETKKLDEYLEVTRIKLKDKCYTLCDNINFGEFKKPKGGYFVWLSTDIDCKKMLSYCESNKVKFHSGNKFSSSNKMENCMRLSFSFYESNELVTGINRLNNSFNYFKNNNKKIFISINGHNGKLGSKIKNYINSDNSYEFNEINRDIDYKPCVGKNVIIDVSSPKGTENLLKYLLYNEIYTPLIIGTTGDLPHKLIELYSAHTSVAIIPNFSYGIPMLEKMLKQLDTSEWKVSITEIHHKDKKDSPSGTAKLLSTVLGGVNNINSIRDDDVYGEHMIKLENDNEVIEFTHKAKTRDIFAYGCIRYVDWILRQQTGIYNGMTEEKIYIEKWNGCGNTFIILDQKNKRSISDKSKYNIRKLCEETNSDGIIFYKLRNDDFDFEWEYYNKDSSLVEMCGNGARCISKLISNKINKNKLNFKNNFNIIQSSFIKNDFVEVIMPEYEGYQEYDNGFFVKVGVPHFVLKVDNVNSYDLQKLYQKINNYLASKYIEAVSDIESSNKYSLTWEKCNVNIYQLKDNVCYVRTFEKGVEEETGACGSGCCAVFHELKSEEIKFITTSGDKLFVKKYDDGLYLSSEIKREFRAYI